ncbi:MAG: ribose-phosphate pyrophosphokinase [Planctomycetota bacterium]
MGELKVFAGRNARSLTESICAHIDMPIGEARTDIFPDGEMLVRIDEDVRGRDCFVVSSTCDPVNDNLMELLIFCDCLKRASARRITLVLPYYGYARQDRKSQGRTPITAKLVANMITAARADRVLTVDLHAAQIQGFFDLPFDHLSATPVFIEYLESIKHEMPDLCLVSPDVGNVKVAEGLANHLGGDLAIINKRRLAGDLVETSSEIIGTVEGKTVLMFDDMISTGGTVAQAAELVVQKGARDVVVGATHAVLAAKGAEKLANGPISRVVVTDTIPMEERKQRVLGDKLVVLSVAGLLGDAIRNIHEDQSVSALFKHVELKR